jgi:ATP-dependent Clp protease, protease subunit
MNPNPFARSFDIFAKALQAHGVERGFTSKKKDDTGDLLIYDAIGEDMWTGGGVTPKGVAEQLKNLSGVKTLNIYINSPGGSVFDGEAIYNQLRRFEAKKNVIVDGLAASAASFIAMAGDKITMGHGSQMMIHRAMGGAYGFESDLRAVADVLGMLSGTIADIYAKRTGKPQAEILALMDAETWMDPQKALELGFADEALVDEPSDEPKPRVAAQAPPVVAAIEQTRRVVASLATMKREITLSKFRNTASRIAARVNPETK